MQAEQRKMQEEQGHVPPPQGQTPNPPADEKVDWIQWVMNSQFRNVIILSAVALVIVVLSSVASLFKSSPQPHPTEKETQAKQKKDANTPQESAEESEGATAQEKKVRKRG